MKLDKKSQAFINNFTNQYLDTSFKIDWNVIKLSKGDGYIHNLKVCLICLYLLENNIPFATQTRFKSGYRPDILCPLWIKPIIEVRATETFKRTTEKFKRIPNELLDKIIYVEASETFLEEEIL